MDSGNSGSLQSSSGGDEEYDSRAAAADSVSAFIRGGPISNPPPPFFDPLPNYLQLHQNPNSYLLDPNPAWSRITSLRSNPSPITHGIISPNINMLPSSSTFMPSFHPAAAGTDSDGPTHTPQLPNQNQTEARNTKKRSRASRRAPTTVLTTDTTNFRAMVQEFTGIPAPPLDSSSFPKTRLDIFGSRSSVTSYDAPLLPYLLRPFARKVQQPLPFLAPTSAAAAIGASSSINNNNNITSVISSNTITPSTSNPAINYQTSSNLFQNPFLNSLLQTNPKIFPLSDSMASKPQRTPFQIPSNDHSHTQFGLSGHGNNFIPSDQISLQNDRNNNTDTNKDENDDDGVNLRSLNGDYNFPSNTANSKMNNSSSSASDFHHERGKRLKNNAAGEGMLESWICSSE